MLNCQQAQLASRSGRNSTFSRRRSASVSRSSIGMVGIALLVDDPPVLRQRHQDKVFPEPVKVAACLGVHAATIAGPPLRGNNSGQRSKEQASMFRRRVIWRARAQAMTGQVPLAVGRAKSATKAPAGLSGSPAM